MEYNLYLSNLKQVRSKILEIKKEIKLLNDIIYRTNQKNDPNSLEFEDAQDMKMFENLKGYYSNDLSNDIRRLEKLQAELEKYNNLHHNLTNETKVEFSLLDRIQELSGDISISAIEKFTGLSNGTIRRWDTSYPSIEKLVKVADYFGVTLDYLIGRNITGNTILLDDILTKENIVTVKSRDDSSMDFNSAEIMYLNDASKKLLLTLSRSIIYNENEMLQQDLDFYDGKIDSTLKQINKED